MDYPLNTNWVLWYHSINDKSWTKSSYKRVYTINNLYELYGLHDVVKKFHLQNGMFFLMREDVFPTWEDPDNREGCCVSYKVPGRVLQEEWKKIVNRVVTEDILVDTGSWTMVNGVSVAPKKEFNIVKIWIRNQPTDYTELLKEYEPFYMKEKAIVKAHELSE